MNKITYHHLPKDEIDSGWDCEAEGCGNNSRTAHWQASDVNQAWDTNLPAYLCPKHYKEKVVDKHE